jgi:spermidine synthase
LVVWIHLVFLLSGLTALVYEVAWVRLFALELGAEVHAVAIVVAAFFLGLALGGWLFGRLADRVRRPIRLYGLLEIGIGTTALLLPTVLESVASVIRPLLLAPTGGGIAGVVFRFAPAFVLLLAPTILMGGTLPVLARALARRHPQVAEGTGALYALNTLGAAAGTFVTGFVLLATLGLRATTGLAAGVNLAIGVTLLLLSDRTAEQRAGATLPGTGEPTARPPSPAGSDDASPGRSVFAILLAAFAVSGFATMAYQVLWTRAFAQTFQNSIYSFTAILTAYLLGIGGGSLYLALKARAVRRPAFWFGIVQALIGVAAIGTLAPIRNRHESAVLASAVVPGSWLWIPTEEFLFALGVLCVPTFLMGAAFPVLVKAAVRGSERVGRRVGALYAANTAGGVLGPLAAAFVLLPLLETRTALVRIAAVQIAAGVAVVVVAARSPRIGFRLPAAAALALLAWGATATAPESLRPVPEGERLVEYREAPDGNLSVVETADGSLRLAWNRTYNLGGTEGLLIERRQGHLPVLRHPDPKRVLILGLGTGDTAGAVGTHPGLEVDCVEIMPAVVEMSRLFRDTNYAVHENPRVRILPVDGRTFLRGTDATYDLVIGDLYLPRRRGIGALYTLEHFEAMRRRLRPGGFAFQWLPLHQLRREDLGTIVRTFLEVFPDARLWMAYLQALHPVVALAGSVGEVPLPLDRLERRIRDEAMARILDEAGFPDAREVVCLHVCGAERLRAEFGGSPLSTDDLPRIEFTAPVSILPESAQGLENLRLLVSLREPIDPGLVPEEGSLEGTDSLAAVHRATGHLLRGHVELLDQRIRPLLLPSKVEARRERVSREFLEALEAAPHFLSAVYSTNSLFHEFVDSDDLESAEGLARAAVAIRPDSHVLRFDLAEVLLLQEKTEEAIPHLEYASELRPAHFETLIRLGIAYGQVGRRDAAIETLERARRAGTMGSIVHKALGLLYLEAGRYDEAVEALDVARRVDPTDADVARALDEARRRRAQPPR